MHCQALNISQTRHQAFFFRGTPYLAILCGLALLARLLPPQRPRPPLAGVALLDFAGDVLLGVVQVILRVVQVVLGLAQLLGGDVLGVTAQRQQNGLTEMRVGQMNYLSVLTAVIPR